MSTLSAAMDDLWMAVGVSEREVRFRVSKSGAENDTCENGDCTELPCVSACSIREGSLHCEAVSGITCTQRVGGIIVQY